MATEAGNNGNVRFGLFEFNRRSLELRRNGVRVKLQDQPGQILSALLEAPGDLVSREELRKRLWAADTFVDFDHSLNTAIKRLRDALGDSAENPIFIETLSRRGYRFMAPITPGINGSLHGCGEGEGAADNGNSALAVGALAGKWSARVLWWGFAGLLLTAGAVSAGWHAGHRTVRPIQPREISLTSNSPDAPVESGAISPDGRLLLYSDKVGLHVKDMASGEIHQIALPQEFKVTWGSWYPDQSHVLLTAAASAKERPGLWKLSLLGGAPQKLVDDGENGRLSPDGKKIAFLRGAYPQREIWSVNVDGSDARKEVESGGYIYGVPVWSPESHALAYVRVIYFPNWNDEDVQLETHVLGTDKREIVMKDRKLGGGLAWIPDGRLFFTLAEPAPSQGDSNLWAIPIDGRTGMVKGEKVQVTNGPDDKAVMDTSVDGKKILFLRANMQPAVYVAKIDAKSKTVGWPERLTLDDQKNLPYEWTPDGKAVLYISDREGKCRIYKQAVGSGIPEVLDTGADVPNILRLNPDRTKVLYATLKDHGTKDVAIMRGETTDGKEGAMDGGGVALNGEPTSNVFRIRQVPLAGGTPKTVLEWPEINNFQCARLPSQECVFSSSANQSLEFYEFEEKTGKASLLFKIGDPEWSLYNWTLSPDGTQLALAKYLRAQEEAEIQIMSLRGGSTRKIALKEWRSIRSIDWAADGKSIWTCASPREDEEMIVNVDLQGHVKQAVKEPSPYIGWAIPSQDGKRLAIWEASGASNVWMLENF